MEGKDKMRSRDFIQMVAEVDGKKIVTDIDANDVSKMLNIITRLLGQLDAMIKGDDYYSPDSLMEFSTEIAHELFKDVLKIDDVLYTKSILKRIYGDNINGKD